MKGYKGFKKGLICRDTQYTLGMNKFHGSLSVCNSGFHFCEKLSDVFTHYPYYDSNEFAEVEAVGVVVDGVKKYVTNQLNIIKVLTKEQIQTILDDEILDDLEMLIKKTYIPLQN